MKVLVLMGGDSPERDVSLASARAIVGALQARGHQVWVLDPADGTGAAPASPDQIPADIETQPPDTRQLQGDSLFAGFGHPIFDEIDFVFLALHGGSGENGTVQAVLDLMGLPYNGSGVLASALCMNKAMSKTVFEQVGVHTAPWISLGAGMDPHRLAETIFGSLELPVVVKPNSQGSTIGFSIVKTREQLIPALELASEYDNRILVEKFIPGREMTVAVLGDEALPVVEIVPSHGVYDYECKYTKGKTEYVVPAELPEPVRTRLQDQALLAFTALQCDGYGRVDFRLDPDNQPYCLEVNTLPGMTATSLVPKAARSAGIDFPELIDRILELGMRRHRQQR